MKAIVAKIKELGEVFIAESTKNVEGNKAAGARARKVSLEMEKLLKEFRKVSVAEGK